jgi:hypothetical protein
VLPSLYVKGIVGRCRKKNRHIAILWSIKSRRYSLPGTWRATGLNSRKGHQYSARK